MKKLLCLMAILLLTACSKPTDIVFGPEPLKQMAEQGDQFKKLPEEDRMLLVGYIGLKDLAKAFGSKGDKPVTGRTVGEVLADARAWKTTMKEQEALELKKDGEAAALRTKVLAERKGIVDKLSQSVTVAVTAKKVRPQDYSAGRAFDELELVYAVENKAEKAIRQLKGTLIVMDATGTELGSLPLDFNEPIKALGTLKTNTGSIWRVTRFRNDDISKIADAQFEGMTTRFEVEAIAYADGEVIKAPELSTSK
jgi:hypothetical protein